MTWKILKILYNEIMNVEKAKNITEFSGQEFKETPRNTIDLKKFQQDLNQEVEPAKIETSTITWKEIKALKKSRYFAVKDQFDKSFVLKHKISGIIAEIQALTPVQACKFIGWKVNQVKVIEVINK